ncbi:MAG: T9SS type A sorting domain-containing protein [Saprospiraceae bacterium]|nr:T9SS type A sorting domain-containing protein [Saprospiraceae bacterium]
MSRLLLLSLCCFLSQSSFSQSICMQVLSSSGGSATLNGQHHDWTVGEVATLTIAGAGRKFTQGFQQPDVCISVSTHQTELADWNIEVFPNPATDLIQVRFSPEQTGGLSARIMDITGRLVLDNQWLDQADGSPIDCSTWPAGAYFLQLTDPKTRAIATVRIIRL